MLKYPVRMLLGLVLIAMMAAGTLPAAAASSPSFTITARSTFLRQSPSPTALRTYSVFQNQTFNVTGRTADNVWLRLDFPGGAAGTWIRAVFGTVAGDLSQAPVIESFALDLPGTTASASPLRPSGVTQRVMFTVTVASVFARSAPSLGGTRVVSLFKGQKYLVRARSADGQWVQLDYGAATEVWIRLGAGVVSGNLGDVPLAGDAPVVAAPAPARVSRPQPVLLGAGHCWIGTLAPFVGATVTFSQIKAYLPVSLQSSGIVDRAPLPVYFDSSSARNLFDAPYELEGLLCNGGESRMDCTLRTLSAGGLRADKVLLAITPDDALPKVIDAFRARGVRPYVLQIHTYWDYDQNGRITLDPYQWIAQTRSAIRQTGARYVDYTDVLEKYPAWKCFVTGQDSLNTSDNGMGYHLKVYDGRDAKGKLIVNPCFSEIIGRIRSELAR